MSAVMNIANTAFSVSVKDPTWYSNKATSYPCKEFLSLGCYSNTGDDTMKEWIFGAGFLVR